MGLIHITTGAPILIEDTSTPVNENAQHCIMFKCLEDAEYITGVPRADIVKAANNGVAIKGYDFSWPSLKEVASHFPSYRQVRHNGVGVQAKPTTFTYVTPGPHSKKTEFHYPSMTAARLSWDMSEADFSRVIGRHPGWKSLLPDGVVNVRVHSHGWKPRGGFSSGKGAALSSKGPAFELRQLKTSISIKYIGPSSVSTLGDVPNHVLKNSRFV
jgi:hypothetical protein